MAAIDKMISGNWPAKWNDPEAKRAALAELRADLQTAFDEAAATR